MTPEIRRFGEELREFINSDEVFSVLPEGDWGAGGCWILAKALVKYLGPPAELWAVYSETFPAEHVVVKHDDAFFDYNGVSTAEELLGNFASSYPNRWGIGLAPLTKYRAQRARQGGIPCETEYVEQVLAKLRARFGPHEYH
jgi:hypothetical protein